MFGNKAFNIALFISLLWHMTCIFAVNIVMLPGRFRARELTSVSFLGPILEKTALEIMLANKPAGITTSYQRGLKYRHSISEKRELYMKDNAGKYINVHAEDKIEKALIRTLAMNKKIPSMMAQAKRRYVYFKDSRDEASSALHREIIYKPEKPKLPLLVDSVSPFKLELEFVVSGQGDVIKVAPVISSGNPEIDLIGIRYLKEWRFAPRAQNMDEDQAGRVTFIFDSEGRRQ